MRKNTELRIKMTTESYNKLKKDSAKVGMTASGYARFILENSTVSVTISDRR